MKNLLSRLAPLVIVQLALLTPQIVRADYQSTVLADGPSAYYRFNDSTVRNLINQNIGSIGAAGNASNDLAFVTGGIVHTIPGAIVGDPDLAEFFDFTTRTEIPFNAALNTPNTQPFTVESWILPVSDQAATGMGVWCNRYTQGSTRQGWVMYQRAPDYNHNTNSGPGVGWEFRMYNNQDANAHLDVTSGVPFTLGKWQHVAVVYDPVQVTNATITIYIDGEAAATNIWSTSDGITPGYYACQDTNDIQPNGPPAISLGGYNNANGGTDGFENPWIGGIDEFAWYPAKLTPAQILAHYQSGTNGNRTQSYTSLIQSDGPAAYLRLSERASSPDVAVNFGDDRSAANGTNTSDVRHPAFSALTGRKAGGAAAYHQRNGSSTTDIQYLPDNNPGAGVPFTFETWLRPLSDRQNPGAAPVNNRYVSSGNRTGWVIFQRAPNTNYNSGISGYSGLGWTFRMYSGVGSGGQDVLTDVPYPVGQWQQLAVTWQPQTDNGDVGSNGNDQWEGILTAYVDGEAVATNSSALYAANVNPTEDGTIPADFAVGSYNNASGLGSNPYEGDVDHLAFYNNSLLTPAQILAHYQAGTNSNYGTNYESLVFNAGGDLYLATNGYPIPEGTTIPKTYLTFNDPAQWPATNYGSLGFIARGNLTDATNTVAGPQPPAYAGFEATNTALALNGTNGWASFNNPPGLNITGKITLEAWIQPAAAQGPLARIISHGPQTISSYEAFVGTVDPAGSDFQGATTNTTEVFLRIDDGGANYSVGSAFYDDGTGTTNISAATFPVPAADLGGSNWVHLVGTYDGANWNLYRNGTWVATQASTNGVLGVDLGDWAVGATGEGWADNFNGAIDEVAIYGSALSPNQVASHFLTAKAGTAAITVQLTGDGNVSIAWPAGTILQQSAVVEGPYTDVPGPPVSPLVIPANGTKFYRWRM